MAPISELQPAEKIARDAGRYLMEKRAELMKSGGVVRETKGRNDFVTAADKGAELLIREGLAKAFPGEKFLGEETGGAAWNDGAVWIVDPLDGTTNFIHGLPLFSVSIGRLVNGQPDLGVIYDPSHDECFSGGPGLGATLNGTPIRCREAGSLKTAFLATGFPFRQIDRFEEYLLLFAAATRASEGMRRCGSAAIDLAWTAAGRFHGFFELGLSPWDIAAGWAIIEGAGGKVSDLYDDAPPLPNGHILATCASIHEELHALFRASR